MKDWKKCSVSSEKTILEVLKIIDFSGSQIALIVDENNKLIGTVTDGDIRRAILAGISLGKPVSEIMNCNPSIVHEKHERSAILMKMQEKRIIKKAQCLLQTTENSIPKLKKLWFKAAIGTDSTQYLEVAEKIDKIIKIKEINQSNFKFGSKELGNLIFQTESKNRILAMFMGCFAAVVALSIKSGATIDDLISFYSDAPFLTLLFLDFLLSIFLLLAILITKLAFLFIFDLFSSWSDSLNKQKAISPRRAKIFINQLLYFYDLPKGKFKIKTGFISIK